MGFGVTTGQTATATLSGDGWFPALSVADFCTVYRLPAEYAESLMLDHLGLAQLWAASLLASWKEEQRAAGYTSLEAVELYGIQGGATLVYKRAVYSHAKGLLLQNFPSIERREAARNDAKDAPETADVFFAAAQKAIATIQGRTFISVEAI